MGNLKQSDFFAMADWTDMYGLSYQYDQHQANLENGIFSSKDLQSFTNFSVPDEMQIETFCTAIQSHKEAVKFNASQDFKQEKLFENENVLPTSLLPMEIPKSYILKKKQLSGEGLNKPVHKTSWAAKKDGELSTLDVMKFATSSAQLEWRIISPCFIDPTVASFQVSQERKLKTWSLPTFSWRQLTRRATKYMIEQAIYLQCNFLSSNVGRPVQRVVYYFADALQERINRETGRISVKESVGSGGTRLGEELEKIMMGPDPAAVACHQLLPISQVSRFTEIEVIIENMASAKRIHSIDLNIKIGIQWSVLMQALAVRPTCPVELLKITAVGTFAERIAETGRQLASFAEMLKLPFIFKAAIVSDMKDIKEDLFEIEEGEAVGVYAPLVLRTTISQPDCLEHVLRVIRNLNPCMMTVTEVEGNHNSCSFINRFIEALFCFSAWFDCLDGCMDRNDCNRLSTEDNFVSLGIRSIVATEGNDRAIRHVGIDLWRSFFTRFGFIETEPSVASLYQARLVAKQFARCSYLNFDMSGKSLTIGWKGTPLISFSSWKLR